MTRPFLVIESDYNPEIRTGLNQLDPLAVIQWLRQDMRLRAVVCTGGKSLHGWFDYPNEKARRGVADHPASAWL